MDVIPDNCQWPSPGPSHPQSMVTPTSTGILTSSCHHLLAKTSTEDIRHCQPRAALWRMKSYNPTIDYFLELVKNHQSNLTNWNLLVWYWSRNQSWVCKMGRIFSSYIYNLPPYPPHWIRTTSPQPWMRGCGRGRSSSTWAWGLPNTRVQAHRHVRATWLLFWCRQVGLISAMTDTHSHSSGDRGRILETEPHIHML